MTHTTARVTDTGLEDLEPARNPSRDAVHFRRIVTAQRRVDEACEESARAVASARAAGDSWTVIGAALGVSKEAVRKRFG